MIGCNKGFREFCELELWFARQYDHTKKVEKNAEKLQTKNRNKKIEYVLNSVLFKSGFQTLKH